jgi:UDP-3-O-[3-hydroxymyristoyl] glucosamine N-acyltransferase
MPVQDNRTWRKNIVRLRQLDEMARRLKNLEKKFGED